MCLVHWFKLSEGMPTATIGRTQSADGTEVQQAGMHFKGQSDVKQEEGLVKKRH